MVSATVSNKAIRNEQADLSNSAQDTRLSLIVVLHIKFGSMVFGSERKIHELVEYIHLPLCRAVVMVMRVLQFASQREQIGPPLRIPKKKRDPISIFFLDPVFIDFPFARLQFDYHISPSRVCIITQ